MRAELELTKDINSSQEQTILDLQQQQSDQKSANKVVKLSVRFQKFILFFYLSQPIVIIELLVQVYSYVLFLPHKITCIMFIIFSHLLVMLLFVLHLLSLPCFQIKELEKKCSNMKLLMSQKMEELEYSRKSIKSLEKDLSDMQVNCD